MTHWLQPNHRRQRLKLIQQFIGQRLGFHVEKERLVGEQLPGQFGDISHRNEFARHKNSDAIANLLHLMQMVGGQQDRHTLLAA